MAAEKGRTLSKNILYTPLEAYIQDDAKASSAESSEDPNHPSQYMKNLWIVPKAIQESSLAAFLHSVSQDYHRNWATPNDARNNGSRSLTLDDVESRIRQRAVTLLGGGINASFPTSFRRHNKIGPKKRRRKTREEMEQACTKTSRRFKPNEFLNEMAFLRKLNQKWNEYMYQVIMMNTSELDNDHMDIESLQDRIVQKARSVGRFEKVGAHVLIEGCTQHKAWTGRYGIIISETLRTYHITWMAVSKEGKTKATEERDAPTKSVKSYGVIEKFILPKQGTTLVLFLPFPTNPLSDGKDAALGDPSSETFILPDGKNDALGDLSSETLIPLPDKTIYLILKEGV
jgi:hypothetical protein